MTYQPNLDEICYPYGIDLDSLTELPWSVAEFLSKHIGSSSLGLNGLKKFSGTVELLSEMEGTLSLAGLIKLSDEEAELLGTFKCSLWLNGLTQLSDNAAESLSKHVGELVLGSLTQLSDNAAESLSKHVGDSLLLNRL